GNAPRPRAQTTSAASDGFLGMRSLGIGGGGAFGGGGLGGGGGSASSRLANVAETPELLAAVAALPPADADPEIDLERESAADPNFGLRRFLRPYRWPLGLGLALVVLDAIASLLGPVLIRSGLDHGVVDRSRGALWLA